MEAGARLQGLSQREQERFWQDGFLVLNDVFTADEVAGLIDACTAPEDRAWQTSQSTVHSLGLTERHPKFLELARDPRIVERLISLLGLNIQLEHSKLAAKPMAKNAGPFGWHQDFAYFPHTNFSLVAVMVMLDDATPENGCMSMVRGSHKHGLLNHMDEEGYFAYTCQEKLWESNPELVIPITPRVGGISIHHCLTLHGSPPNLSGRPRRGLVFQYRAADAYQLADTVFSDTGLLICGQASDCVRCDAGVLRLPRVRGRCARGFGSAWNQEGEFAARVNGSDRSGY